MANNNEKITFRADVKQAVAGIKKIEKGLNNVSNSAGKAGTAGKAANNTIESGSYKASKGVQNHAGSWLSLAGKIGATVYIVKSYLSALTKVDSLKTRMNVITESAEESRETWEMLRNTANKVGVSFESMLDGYTKFTAATKGGNLSLSETNDIFIKFTNASAALKLSADGTQRVFRALEQMISKGNVQAEELRGQLGENLPGAFKMAADAMGVTQSELNKMLDQGKVLAEDLLPKLANEVQNAYGSKSIKAVNSLTAKLHRMGNAWTEIKERAIEFFSAFSGFGAITTGLNAITSYLTAIQMVLTQLNPYLVQASNGFKIFWIDVQVGFELLSQAVSSSFGNMFVGLVAGIDKIVASAKKATNWAKAAMPGNDYDSVQAELDNKVIDFNSKKMQKNIVDIARNREKTHQETLKQLKEERNEIIKNGKIYVDAEKIKTDAIIKRLVEQQKTKSDKKVLEAKTGNGSLFQQKYGGQGEINKGFFDSQDNKTIADPGEVDTGKIEEFADKKFKILSRLTDKIKKLTLSEYEYKKWALDNELANLLKTSTSWEEYVKRKNLIELELESLKQSELEKIRKEAHQKEKSFNEYLIDTYATLNEKRILDETEKYNKLLELHKDNEEQKAAITDAYNERIKQINEEQIINTTQTANDSLDVINDFFKGIQNIFSALGSKDSAGRRNVGGAIDSAYNWMVGASGGGGVLPTFHAGHIPTHHSGSFRSDERLAKLQAGEAVINRSGVRQNKKVLEKINRGEKINENGGGAVNSNVNINISAMDANGFASYLHKHGKKVIENTVNNSINNNGSIRKNIVSKGK